MSKRERNRDGVWKALNAQGRAGSHTETRLRSIHPPAGQAGHTGHSQPGLTPFALQRRASVFPVPTVIVRSIRPSWLSQNAVCAISALHGRLPSHGEQRTCNTLLPPF
jgi:hypothetical protein